ncbi:hypothetical protein MTO96_024669 [Rhipicephalus appendiculatus]
MALPAAKARRKPKCDTTGVDLYSAVDGFLTRLPMQYALPGQSYRPVVTGIAGIRIGKAEVTGLNLAASVWCPEAVLSRRKAAGAS